MKYNKISILLLTTLFAFSLTSCHDNDDIISTTGEDDYKYIGMVCGNFSAEEWYPGGELGTTDNVGSQCYEDQTPAIDNAGLYNAFKFGEMLFEHDFTQTSSASFGGLGPAYVRTSCIHCHPGYGHGKRVNSYKADYKGNGYLLVFYHPVDGNNSDDGPYISEVTGMPQTKAVSPFLPPVNEEQLNLEWKSISEAEMVASSGLSLTFPDGSGESYTLWYPELTFKGDLAEAFNTDPVPTNVACRLESTIGLYGTGLLDAIPQDSLKKEYERQAASAKARYEKDPSNNKPASEMLNPNFWDVEANDWAPTAWYTLADGQKKIKRFTYAMTRASLQDGAGANAMWNIPNVSRSDRHYLYTTKAWASAMSKNADVIAAIKSDPTSPYYYDGTDEGIAEAVKALLDPTTDQYNNAYHNFKPEMTDINFWQYMVWHRGLAVPRARDLNDEQVQRGKKLFNEMGCATCHRAKWQTGADDYWAPSPIVSNNLNLPTYPYQTIYPYTDMLQHRLYMKNGIHGSWCRTTPLWGRGLSLANTGAEDRLHDCRARNEVEAIMWHCYSKESDAYWSAIQFYKASKADRDAVVKFLRSI